MSTGSLVTLTSYKYQANTFMSAAATQIAGSVCQLTVGFVMLHQLQRLYLGEPLIHWAKVLFALFYRSEQNSHAMLYINDKLW